MKRRIQISDLLELHENAVVAWDRDGVELPEGLELRVLNWTNNSMSDVYNGTWTDDGGVTYRTGGLGVLMGSWPMRGYRYVVHCILHLAPSDPLGVKWHILSDISTEHETCPADVIHEYAQIFAEE